MKIEFYYWGIQCPLILSQLRLLEQFKSRLSIQTFDVTHDFETAKRLRMFFPFLFVINDNVRHFSPVRKEFLEELVMGRIPPEVPYRVALSREPYEGEISPITEESVSLAGRCTGRDCPRDCYAKYQCFKEYGVTTLGFINAENGYLLGGAEYAPSQVVPYDIPHSEDTAFITCVYLSSERYDYKSAPLRHMEAFLSIRYKKAIAVTDESGVFPNGDMVFFQTSGYRDLGVLSIEPGLYRLHLVEKILSSDP
jgi:hypothetical protein